MKVYLLSRLEAFTAANTRVFRVSPAMGMARCWMYEESLKTQHYRLGPCTSQHINHRYKTFLFEGLHKNSLKPFFILFTNKSGDPYNIAAVHTEASYLHVS